MVRLSHDASKHVVMRETPSLRDDQRGATTFLRGLRSKSNLSRLPCLPWPRAMPIEIRRAGSPQDVVLRLDTFGIEVLERPGLHPSCLDERFEIVSPEANDPSHLEGH